MKRILAIGIALVFSINHLLAGEGMWLPIFLKALNENEMQAMGLKISAEDIYSVNQGSLKDAIVHFGGFCTSEVISNNGLLLTNHHCGYGQIQSHSSVDKNYLRDGFWAKNYSDELPNPGLFATFIDRIEDVTSIAYEGVENQMSEGEKQSLIAKNLEAYKEKYRLGQFNELIIRPFYAGNQYFAFFTTKYNDVRLVGTPPESIGKFGSDTDNWVWPRHTGDFSLFRIYAGPNNEPADYSEDNIPFTPKHSLPISMDGVSEGDFTMVFGFPGRTNQYLPSIAVKELVEKQNPAKIKIRDAALRIIDKYMRKDEAIKIQYASKYARVANYWKKWIGESLGLEKSHAIAKKVAFEQDFMQRAHSKQSHHLGIFDEFESNYLAMSDYALILDYYSEISRRNVEILSQMSYMSRLVNAYNNNGEAAYNKMKDNYIGFFENFYKDYRASIDEEVAASLLNMYREDIDPAYHPATFVMLNSPSDVADFVKGMYANSKFTDINGLQTILALPPSDAVKMIQRDPIYAFYSEWQQLIASKVNPTHSLYNAKIDSLQSIYMKAQMDLFPDKKFYPDANSTMRITYGQVEGVQPADGMCYTPLTYLDGAIAKYVPGDYEFDLPQGLLDLYQKKDYGPYTDATGKVPLCFLGSNHTTGGNSGSPAIDAYGNLVGLNFDRIWEGTMSDINYDVSLCRNIMVDTRFILFIIDKYAGANHLIKEMNLVYPKSKK